MKEGENMRDQKPLQVDLRFKKVLRGRKERMYSRISGGNLLQILGSIGGADDDDDLGVAGKLFMMICVFFFIGVYEMLCMFVNFDENFVLFHVKTKVEKALEMGIDSTLFFGCRRVKC